MKQKFAKLIDVKSFVTIFFTILYGVLAFMGNIPQEVNSIYLVIISFYFGTQHQKNNKDGE